jgi:DNA-binding PadR family transcriptional regulator
MRAEVLKGHLEGLLLATLEAGPMHGYAVMEALRTGSDGRVSTCPPGRSIRPCIGWNGPG